MVARSVVLEPFTKICERFKSFKTVSLGCLMHTVRSADAVLDILEQTGFSLKRAFPSFILVLVVAQKSSKG